MSKIRIALGCLAWLALGASPYAWAQDDAAKPAADEKKPEEKVEYVEVNVPYAPKSNTIATKLPVPLNQTPANVGVVTSALFKEQGAFVLTDALRNVSGLNVQGGSGVHDYFLIRGFNSLDGGLILTDGAAEPEVSYYGLYNVEGVEVFKGPAGFLWGQGPTAGAVNLVRKQPLPGDLLAVGATYGSFNTAEATLDWNLANDDGSRAFRLNGLVRESDNFRDDKDSEHFAINPGLTLRFDDDTTLNVNLEYVEADYRPDSGIPLLLNAIPDVPRERSYQSPLDFSEQEIARFQLDYETRVSERITLRNKAYFRQLDWNTNGTLFFGTIPLPAMFGGPQVLRGLTALDDRQDTLGAQFEAVATVNTGRIRHNLLAGLELTRYQDDFSFGIAPPCTDPMTDPPGCMPAIALLDPLETASSSNVFAFPFLIGEGETTVVAPYISDQIVFSDKFHIMVGGRYDDIDTEVDFAANFQDGSPGYRRTDGDFSPFGGVVFMPRETLTIYANAGKSFAPIGFRTFGAATLDSEESTQFEAGVKKSFLGGKLHSTFAAYHIERENLSILDDNGVTSQAGDQDSDGFELDVAAELAPSIRLFFSYAYNDSELTRFTELDLFTGMIVDRSGNKPAFTPENLASVWVSKTFGNRIGVGGGARFVDDQFIAEDNAFAIDSAVVVDAAVHYDFDRFRFKLNFRNLTDEEYEVRGFGASSVLPADGFAVYGGVEFRR